MSEALLTWLATASPALVYLAGVVYLFSRLEAAQKAHTAAMNAVIDRYHEVVKEQVHVLALINEQLEKK